jgi:hypothetical protein
MTLAVTMYFTFLLDFKNGFVITYEYHYVHPVTNDIYGLNPLPFSRLPQLIKASS